MIKIEISEIITTLVVSVGALAAEVSVFYLLYYFEKSGTWNSLVDTKNRKTLASEISLIAGIIGGMAFSSGQEESLTYCGRRYPWR